jgi:hypothetical protein
MLFRVLICVPALAVATPSRAQMVPATPDQEAKARGDLQGALLPGAVTDDGWSDNGRTRQTYFYTLPIATNTRFLCQRDRVQLEYISADRVDPAKATEASGVQATRQYRFAADPRTEGDWASNPPNAECRKFGGADERGWFTADSKYVAVDAHNALRAAIARLQARRPVRGCTNAGGTRGDCRDFLLRTPLDSLTAVRKCESSKRGHFCYEIAFPGEMLVRLRVRYTSGTEPIVIERVTVEYTGDICV